MKLKGLLLAMVLLLCAGNTWAAVKLSGYSLDAGATYVTGSSLWGPNETQNYEFNLTLKDSLEGIKSTYGYCVDLNQDFQEGARYQSRELTGDYFKAAWLVDTYSTFTATGTKIQGTTDALTISALQAAVWNVLGQKPATDYTPVSSYDTLTWKGRWPTWTEVPVTGDALTVFNLYTDMLESVRTIANVEGLGLESKFQLLTNGCSQDLLVRTSTVPLPGAAVLFGSGLLGLVGLRRRQIR